MKKGEKETDARIIIDRFLREASWDIEDKTQVATDEAAADGRADYLLKDNQGRPLAVIEAKRFSIEPNTAQQQAKEYAESISAPYVFLSNGEIIYFWDYIRLYIDESGNHNYSNSDDLGHRYRRRELNPHDLAIARS